ncbi:cell division protein FtsL [Candidatus Desantisbacteria bacterium CG07_land_8_20_14_0_80_39_15]|uniref:Cell division protein FtsL n=1 Tax=Candidatus Desantisbacteria bacterium CG07_land_8_20_14_0_80_39_15 TaxID=1974549 RepID=A0A2M6ZGV8_9BACT|nr:MAG: cell division protein FtsL [Candidatus Desantisbacteria bacterium CG07_land_8_20_14_0_80_39_15]
MKQILLSDYYPDFFKSEEDEEEKEENRSKSKVFLICCIVMGVLLFIGLVYLRQRVQYAKLSYEISQFREDKKKVENENGYLQIRMKELNSLSRIERIAKEQLGLIVPKEIKIIQVSGLDK